MLCSKPFLKDQRWCLHVLSTPLINCGCSSAYVAYKNGQCAKNTRGLHSNCNSPEWVRDVGWRLETSTELRTPCEKFLATPLTESLRRKPQGGTDLVESVWDTVGQDIDCVKAKVVGYRQWRQNVLNNLQTMSSYELKFPLIVVLQSRGDDVTDETEISGWFQW